MSGTNGGINPSIPLQVTPPQAPQNPLATVGQFVQTANALNQLKLFPLIQQQQQLKVQQEGLQYGLAAYNQIQSRLATHLGDAGDIDPKNLIKDATDWASSMNEAFPDHPPIQMGQVVKMVSSIPMPPGTGADAWKNQDYQVKLRAHLKNAYANTLGPVDRLTAMVGAPANMNTGQSIQPGMVGGQLGANPGAFAPAGQATQQYPSRSELASQVPGVGPNNEPTAVPLSTRLQQQGAGALGGPAVVNSAGAPVGPANPPRLTPPAAAPQGAPQASLPAAPAPAPTGAVPVGLPPGAPEEFAASAQQYNAASAAANNFRQRIFPLEQAATALKSADTGPGSETVNHIKSFLLAQAPSSLQRYLPGVDPNKIANYDEAVKYLANYAMNQPGAANSDMHLSLAQAANASTHISSQAAQQVVQNALGLERMQQAALAQFNNTHPPGSGQQYSRWLSGSFIPQNDPRGFSWDTQSAAQQKSALASMTRADKERLARSVTLARQLDLTGAASGQ